MKIGVNLWTVYGWQPDRPIGINEIAAIAKMGAKGIELIIDEAYNSAERLIDRYEELSSLFLSLNLDIPSIATTLFGKYPFTAQDKKTRQSALDLVTSGCKVANRYGAKVFLAIAGKQEPDTPYVQTYETAVTTLRQAATVAHNEGVIIGIENVPGSFLGSPGEFAQFIRDVDHPAVKAYLDFGNGASVGPSYPENWISAVKDEIAMVHAKDYDARHKLYVPCGQGDLDWNKVFEHLVATNYTSFLLVETPPKGGFAPMSTEAGLLAAQASISWLERFL